MYHLSYRRPLILCASTIARSATASTESGGTTRRCVQAIKSVRWSSRSYQSQRAFSGSVIMANPQTPRFSDGVDEPALTRALEHLLISAENGGRWVLIPGGEGLERSFKFKTFAKTWVCKSSISSRTSLSLASYHLSAFLRSLYALCGRDHSRKPSSGKISRPAVFMRPSLLRCGG